MNEKIDIIWKDRKRPIFGLPLSFTKYSVLEDKIYFLYRNTNSKYENPLCRMYVDKSGNDEYAPFYVYKVETSTGVEDVTIGESAVKVMQNGQVLIKRGENVYNVVGVQVK